MLLQHGERVGVRGSHKCRRKLLPLTLTLSPQAGRGKTEPRPHAGLRPEASGYRAAGGADRLARHLLHDLCLGRSGNRHCRRGCAPGRHRGDPQVLRLRPSDRRPVSGLARRCAARGFRALVYAAAAGGGRDLRAPARNHDPRRLRDRLRAGAGNSAGRAGGGATQQPRRPLRPDIGRGRAGHAQLLVCADLDPLARRGVAAVADYRLGQLAELRHAGDCARLLRDAGGDAADACRRAGGALLRLHPHGAGQGAEANDRALQACAEECHHSGGVAGGRAVRLHAGRLDRHRDHLPDQRARLPRLGIDPAQGPADHAGDRAGAVGDLCAADAVRRPLECLSRPATEGGVMAEIGMPRAGIASAEEILAPSPGALLRRRIFHHWGLLIGGTILIVIVLMALLAPLVAPHDPYDQQLARKLIPPIWHATDKVTWAHPLGTDHLGRDYLTRLLYGAQISLLIGVSAMLISGLIGTTIGVLAGYFGGRIDMVVNFIVTTRLSMPVVLVALAVVSLIGSSLTVVIWVLGLLSWARFAVVMRSATQQVRSHEFIAAAQAVGCSTPRILLTEVAPNVLNHLIVVATLEMAHAILLEAALSFLGLGVQPPTPSWGLMISEAKGLMFFDPWLISIPGIALFLLVLAINLLGDGLRDVTAPENRS